MELPVSSNDVSVTGLQLSVALSNTDVGEVAATLGIRGCNCRYHVREKPRGHILLYFSQKKNVSHSLFLHVPFINPMKLRYVNTFQIT